MRSPPGNMRSVTSSEDQLLTAAREGDVELVAALLDGGADPNTADRAGFTPLHIAAQEQQLEAARLLLDRGANVDALNSYGNTPLWTAVFNSRGRGDIVQLLRARGADPHHANDAGKTPFELARLIDNYDVAQYFAELE